MDYRTTKSGCRFLENILKNYIQLSAIIKPKAVLNDFIDLYEDFGFQNSSSADSLYLQFFHF